jgi:hypothetical protein
VRKKMERGERERGVTENKTNRSLSSLSLSSCLVLLRGGRRVAEAIWVVRVCCVETREEDCVPVRVESWASKRDREEEEGRVEE